MVEINSVPSAVLTTVNQEGESLSPTLSCEQQEVLDFLSWYAISVRETRDVEKGIPVTLITKGSFVNPYLEPPYTYSAYVFVKQRVDEETGNESIEFYPRDNQNITPGIDEDTLAAVVGTEKEDPKIQLSLAYSTHKKLFTPPLPKLIIERPQNGEWKIAESPYSHPDSIVDFVRSTINTTKNYILKSDLIVANLSNTP